MYKRFFIICLIIAAAFAGLLSLGNSALRMHAQSLQIERQNQFVSVAEQIRLDVKRKLDDFIAAEQKRPYTDYLPVYVPETTNQAAAFVRSPLANSLSHGLAYGYFQLDADGSFILPSGNPEKGRQQDADSSKYVSFLNKDLLSALGGKKILEAQRFTDRIEIPRSFANTHYQYADRNRTDGGMAGSGQTEREQVQQKENSQTALNAPGQQPQSMPQQQVGQIPMMGMPTQQQANDNSQFASNKSGKYTVRSLEDNGQVQVISQQRQSAELNIRYNDPAAAGKTEGNKVKQPAPTKQMQRQDDKSSMQSDLPNENPKEYLSKDISQKGFAEKNEENSNLSLSAGSSEKPRSVSETEKAAETVQIRIEPFTPLLVPYFDGGNGVFSGQVFLLRHIQIEKTHLLQGFQLNQTELLAQVKDSVRRFLRDGMGFEISRDGCPEAAYTAILDFGFGELGLHLLELDTAWVGNRISLLSTWFYSITSIVGLAVVLAMFSLWRSLNEQVRLSRKKDDFISAVSHELRTPLTSIRMYAEMLEKDWVPTEQKRREYYSGMRQETERLSRLIENVLDFSRIQRGKKQYQFVMGDVNDCLSQTVQLMQPCAKKAGFELYTELSDLESFAFDRDAVMQIAINLIDNACKYARPAADNRITLRTRKQDGYILIEVEDHGPGIPRREQSRIFEAFYRCADESTRQTTGTGLGLALVKRFAEAHKGFVQIAQASPSGCIFRVALADIPA